MTPVPLPWWDWLTMSPYEIRKTGNKPGERYSRIGHRRALSKRWACTVGRWVLEEPKHIMLSAGLDPSNTNHRSSFDFFRHRWKVRSRIQMPKSIIEASEDTPAWVVLAEEVYTDVASALRGEEPVMKPMESGDALVFAATQNGVLPVEAMVYSTGLSNMLEYHGIDIVEYVETVDRHLLWNHIEFSPWLPDVLRTRYATEA